MSEISENEQLFNRLKTRCERAEKKASKFDYIVEILENTDLDSHKDCRDNIEYAIREAND